MARKSSRTFNLLALALMAAALSGCTAQHQAGPVTSGLSFQIHRADFWLRAPRTQDPVAASAEAVDAGRSIYSNQCSSCHNADGKGTVLGLSMYPEATDLTTHLAQGYSDRELYYLLWNGIGHSGMPRWDSQLQPVQVWQVIHYMRTMPGAAKPSADTAENTDQKMAVLADGRRLFKTQGCMECHSIEGKPADSPDLTYEGDRGRSREWLVGHFIDPPAYSPGSDMPSYGKLTGDQLNALALFLNSLKRGTAMPNHNSGN
jgi:mono/diheme cytochrome c family protein